MGRQLNLAGQKFNKLLAIEPTDERRQGAIVWKFLCDCGNYYFGIGSNVKNGYTKSCGCFNKNSKIKDYTGVRVGKLVVIKIDDTLRPKTKRGNIRWLCQCDCGNTTSIESGDLHKAIINNRNSSCGCYKGKNDLTGRRFGKLTVIQDDIVENEHRKWLCKCDCGNNTIVLGISLLSGKTQSCGCIIYSIGEENIINLLNHNKINYEREYTFYDLRSDNHVLLRYDFAIKDKDNNIIRLIEFDGEQHTNPNCIMHGQNHYEKIICHDMLKNNYAINHNIPLVRIPYTKRDNITIDDLLQDYFLVKEI
jgi:hypothetical protein